MEKTIISQNAPYPVDVKSGETYYWCACGRTGTQPFCDGSHKGTSFTPVPFKAEKDETVYFCGCRHSKKSPLCDGLHQD